jgi:beta-lactamase regulating signal transducer with metallopeptidase domain/uncharacterized protein YjbI with pentapeptide repeats
MSAIEHLFTQPIAQAIGWALLQFVWQGAVIGLISAAALFALRRSASDVRYVVATIGLSLMLTLPVVSAVQAWRAPAAGAATRMPAMTAEPAALTAASHRFATQVADDAPSARSESAPVAPVLRDSRLPLLLLGWLCGVTILSLRLLSGWVWIRRITTRGVRPASNLLREIAARLSRRLHIRRRVAFLESVLVDVPTVVGWAKPIVLVPASALVALTPAQIEAIIAHELAHIRRHDYLVNLLQTLIETLLFYHPAVWWLSRRIRNERENCCDDLAVSLCGDAVVYARALADLEVLRGGGGLALAASGGSLVYRVRRVLGAPTHAGRGPGWLAGTVAVLVIAGIAAGALGKVAFSAEQDADLRGSRGSRGSDADLRGSHGSDADLRGLRGSDADLRGLRGSNADLRGSTGSHESSQSGATQGSAVATTPAIAPRTTVPATVEPSLGGQPATATTVAIQRAIAAAIGATTAVQSAQAATAQRLDLASAALATVTGVEAAIAQTTTRSSTSSQKGNFIWTNDDERIEIHYEGRIEFTEDDTDVKSMSPGASLRIREGQLPNRITAEFDADENGNVRRRFWVGSSERPFEPEGRQWLSKVLPRFIRQSGIGAADRVARILRGKGVDGVLAEIDLITGSWAKRVYFSELLKSSNLEPRAIEQILARAGRQIDSDFELASLLTASADRLLVSDATRRAYFDAARSIQSDFEMRRAYAAALNRGAVSSELLAGLLEAAVSVESDFELASLLLQVAKLQPLDDKSRAPFFKALSGVGSDFEHRRALGALTARSDLDPSTLNAILESAALIDSDFESASLLLTVVENHSIESANREAFFRAVESIGSPFERGRVLQTLAKRTDVSQDTVLGILRAAKGISGTFETAQVLMALASRHPLKGPARDLYIEVAERLGEYEQGRALSALVRNERVK